MRKVAIIGLDGVPPQLVFDGRCGELPHLRALMQDGTWGELRSCHPPITVPAWSSMMSSKDPGQLGCYGFRNRRAFAYDDYVLANSTFIKHDRVWDILSRAGMRSIVLGVPQTYPPPALNGHLVSCFLTPSQGAYTYPTTLQDEVETVADGYVFDVHNFRTTDKRELLSRIYEKTGKQFRVARHLLTTKAWEFFMMVEMGPDRLHHAFWKYFDRSHPKYETGNAYADVIPEYYAYLDAEVGETLACLDSDTLVMIVSDHGAKAMHGGICVNEWLVQSGRLTLHAAPGALTRMTAEMVDWSHTRAWGDGGYYGHVFLNVRGREPCGVVDPGDYERVREDLIAEIAAIPDAAGRPLGSRAYRPEELYRATAGVAPDLIAYFGDLSWRAVGSVGYGTIHCGENDSGPDDANHDWNGIFIMRDGGRGSTRIHGRQLMDVAPSVLHHLGVPIPTDMQGHVIDRCVGSAQGRVPTGDMTAQAVA